MSFRGIVVSMCS